MKTGKKVLLTLLSATMLTAGAFGIAACTDDTADVDPKIKAAYDLYVDAAGDTAMTYDQWLATIKGEKGDTGAKGETGAKGDKGDKGDDGEEGKDGKDGATWLFGAADPTQSTGKTGDFYLNTTSFDIFNKTNLTTWTKQGNIKGAAGAAGEAGSAGAAGEAGVGIKDMWLNGNKLYVSYTDEDKEDSVFTLPAELFHEHEYGTNYVTFIEPSPIAEGVAYKVCSKDGHVEFFTLPKIGTEDNPYLIEGNSGKVEVLPTAYGDYMYFEYVMPSDGYLYVTTDFGVDYSERACSFEVADAADFDDYGDAWFVYDHSDVWPGHNVGDKVSAGKKVYIRAEQRDEDFVAADGKYYLYYQFYSATTEVAHKITLKCGDTPMQGVTVQVYGYNEDDVYVALEGKQDTSNEDGIVSINLPIGEYDLEFTYPDNFSYAASTSYSTKISQDFTFKTQIEFVQLSEYTVTVNKPDGSAAEGVKVMFSTSSYGVNTNFAGVVGEDGTVKILAMPGEYYRVYLDKETLPENCEYKTQVRFTSTSPNSLTITLTAVPAESNEVTLTVSGGDKINLEAGKTYVISSVASGNWKFELADGSYFVSFTVGTLEAVKDGAFTTWGNGNAVHETDENGKAIAFQFVGGARAGAVRFTVSADVELTVTRS